MQKSVTAFANLNKICEEHAYRVLVEAMNEGAALLAADNSILYCNGNLASLIKTPMEKLTGAPFRSLLTLSSLLLFDSFTDRDNYKCELTLSATDGINIPVCFSASIYRAGDIEMTCIVVTDLSKQKRDEEILASGKLSNSIIEQASEIILVCDEAGIISRISRMAQQILGGNLLHRHFDELLSFFTDPDNQSLSFSDITSEETKKNIEVRMNRKDGVEFIFLLSTSTLKNIEGDILGRIVILTDITENRHAESALAASEIRYRRLIETAQDAILILDGNTGQILDVNPFALDLLGYTQDELMGKNLWGIGDLQDTLASKISYKELQDKNYIRFDHLPLITKEGKQIDVEVIANAYQVNKKRVFQCNIRDITEQKRTDEEREKTVRLESVGILAGGIAHDFNNILTGILGNVQLANSFIETNEVDTAKEMLIEAEKASFRAKDLTQQLLTFSRGGTPVKKLISINKLIEESVCFVLRGSDIKPEFSFPDNLWTVEADEGQFTQIFSNLVINADQAMPNGGIIYIRANNMVIGTKQHLPLPEGNYVMIDIEDHGTGIPRSHYYKIFDPYFTTKQKGSGLGLATTYSIVKSHGGHITFDSQLGIGTTFHMYLPAFKKKIIKEKKAAAIKTLAVTSGRILIMDNEETILALLNKMLINAGYKVELTRNGDDAIERYTEAKISENPFDAVILDLTVPGSMGGKETIAKLLEIDPRVKAIVSSGYSNDTIVANYKNYGFSGIVNKPYHIEQMQETLRNVLADK